MSKQGNAPADPLQKLRDINEEMNKDNIEHIISKDQVFTRMQMMSTECDRLKQKLIKVKHQKEQSDLAHKAAY